MASTGDDLLPSCLNDPNFAVICAFLQKFSTKLNIVYPDFNDLQKMIENTDEVAEDLKNLIVKLLRKTRKTVHNGKWEHALAKFCYTYSSQDAWEIERFGFKKANLSVKLRVVKEVLESQFERNLKFKTELNLLSAEELRSQPLGKDKLGNAYWSTIDSNLNLRIYQEHLDEDIWKICAHSRDELAKLIACLKGNELVMPSLVGLVDEDSNSMPQVKLDALKNGDVDSDEQNKDPTKSVAEKPKSVEKAEDDEELSDEENESNISEMDVSSQDASESSAPIAETKVNAPVKEKVPPIIVTKTGTAKSLSKTESNSSKLSAKRRLDSESADESASKVPKLQRPTLLSKNQTIKTNKFAHLEGGEDDDRDDDDEDESEEEEEEEEEEEYEEDSSGTEDETDDEEVGDEIVEPVMHVKGLGSGEANEGTFLDLMDLKEENEIGEAIEEDVIFIVGNGSGVENEVGNPENKPKSDKPMFFFGQAGCLKLSPIKVPNLQKMENNIENNVKATNLFNVSTFVDGGGQSSAGLNEIPSNAKDAINEEMEFEKTNENDVDVFKVTQMPNIGEEKSSTTDALSDSTTVDLAAKMDVDSKQSEIQNPEVVPISEMKDQCSEDIEPTAAPDLAETETIGKTESDDHVNKINDGTLTDIVASPLNILPNENSDTAPATIDEKSIECLETLPSQPIQLNTTSDKSIIQDVGEASSDEFVESKDECPDSIAKTEETIEPTHSQDADELIHQLSEPPPDPIQPSEDPENLNVKTCNFIESNSINKDIDTVPESKTENRIESESAVKPIETAIASSDDLMSEKESTAMDVDEKNESSSNAEEDGSADTLQVDEVVNASEQMKIVSASEEMEVVSASEEMEVVSASEEMEVVSASEEKKVASASEQNKVVSTLEVNQTVSALEVNETIASKVSEMVSTSEVNQLTNETELEQSLEVSKNSGEGTVSPEKSSSAEPLETNSCDSKVDSLIIDSGSCSDYTQRGVEGTSSPTATENDTKEKLIESNQNEAVTTLNSSKKVVYQHQTSQSTTEAEDANCNTSAPENFSTLTATNQSDEIVSEPVIDQLTPDVTSISTPSFDDQDNRTNDSILNDQTVSIETPADISIKEIGKFQIFNRKVDEDPSKRFSEQNDEVANCPPKLQYEGSEETKTPLVLTQPTISEVPPTEHTPKSIDLNKESISSSSLIDKPTDKPELVNPLQSRPSSVEVANSKQDTLTKFPISFNNTHINNRKRPLASKNDFDSDESSSESSEEEVEVKRQKTKPKFSHLAARKNAEIKRKATQIDCSTDEDEPVNPIQLKIISTELSKIEYAAKQKKILNDKTPIKLTKDDGPATSLQTIRTSTVKPPVQIESIFGKEKLEPVCLTMPTAKFESKTIPAVESATNLIPEKKAVFENIKHVNAAPTIVNAILSKTLAKTLDDKTLIQEPETSKIDVKSIEEIQPKETIPTVEEIDLKGEIKLKEEVKFMEETKPKDEIKLKEELTLKDEQKLKVETVSVEEKKLKEQIKSRDDPLLKEEAKSKVELKIVPEIESKDETKCTQPTEKEETKMKIELEKTADVKSEPKVENKMEVLTQEKPQTKNEVHDVPQEDLKIISESETTKIETPSTKPGPKSKKQGFVSAQASSIENADASASMDPSKDEDVNESQPEKVPTTARTRTTRAAVTASQPSTDSNVPEPIQKPTSSPPKGTPSTVTKPTPLKLATVQPKKAVKAKPPPKPKAPKKSPQPTVAKEPTKEPTASSEPSATKKETPRKRKLMGLIVDDNAILATNDGETPVRQSRRIAQIKIKEEAERRKEEETALKQMKAASDKKKKVVDETYSAKSESDASEVDSEQKLEMKKKNKKKVKGANPWQTDSENAESDVSEEEHYESDHKLVFFKSDHEFSPESDIEDESQIVQTKRARTARKDDEHEIIDDGYACQKCKKHDHPDWILLCDKCDKGYHCSCLIPMLFIIPEGDWFCPPCQQEKLIETLEGQLQNLDKDLKEKELEEIRRQRAAFISISAANVLPDEVDEIETEYQKPKSIRKRPTTSRRRRRNDASDRSNGSSSSSSGSSRSEKSGKSSSGSNSSDDEPIYKLRKRRQTNVSYRFNEYDDLINSAIKKEMDSAEGAGNLGRGKDISTIMEADKEEKRIKQLEDDDDDADDKNVSSNANDVEMKSEEADVNEMKTKSESNAKASASDSDSEPIRKTLKRPLSNKSKKKHRKLNSLDIESEDDGSDDDFRTSSFSEDEEDENFSAGSESDSSLDAYRKKNKKHETRRPVRSRRKRYDDAFINDSDGDDVDEPKVTTRKKKKKEDSDFSEFNENESTDEEAEEDVDSDDLCDSTDSNESDRGWRSKKAKKSNQKKPRPATDASSNAPKTMPKKKVKKVEDTAFRAGIPKSKGKSISDESDDEDVQAKSRRTRGKKLTYLNLLDEFDSDSDSDGIKPGVKRPDTPPEERAAFIKKQEEIKRMLAEKNTEAAAALAAPKLTGSTPEKARRPAGPVDSLSTIPRQIIQNAKALDPDYKKGRESDDTDGFDDDLPDDFDAEGMDEDEIAKMMEEEDFAQQQLKAVGERVRKMKEAELLLNKKKEATKVTETSVITPIAPPVHIPAHLATPPSVVVPPSSFSPRPSMPLSHLIRPPHSSPLSPGNIQHMQPHHPQHSPHSPHGSQHMPIHPHLPPHGPHGPHPPHHLAALNQAHQMVRGPPHHLLHPSQHSMQHFNPLQRHPMQLTQSPHISPNSQPPHMQHRPIHPSIRSPHHHPLQMHPSQMQSHLPPSMVADYPGDPKMMKLTKSGVEPKKRGRKSKAELQAIEQAKGIPDPSTSMGPSLLQHTAHAPGQEPIIPTTVLAVQNTRLMDPSELGPPGASVSDVKKRGRRKKFTPLRESLNKSGVEAPPSGLEQKTNPILAERLGIQDNRSNLSIATPPQLFSPSTVGQPSVITRLPRPPLGSPYGPGGPQRFYPPQPGQPPVSIAQSTRIPFSPHGPPPPLTSSPAPSSNGAPATNHYVQSEQMSRQSASLSAHFRSPAPAHFSGQPSNYQPAPGMPALIHRGGLQPIDRSIEGAPSTPQDYSTPAVPIPYAASYGTYYPPHHPANVEHRPQPPPPQQQPTTTTAPSPLAPANSSFEQFDNAKNTPPHDRATPNSYQSPPTTEEPAASSSEFSGLVSYFSSQQDDLET